MSHISNIGGNATGIGYQQYLGRLGSRRRAGEGGATGNPRQLRTFDSAIDTEKDFGEDGGEESGGDSGKQPDDPAGEQAEGQAADSPDAPDTPASPAEVNSPDAEPGAAGEGDGQTSWHSVA